MLDTAIDLLRKHGVVAAWVFGSREGLDDIDGFAAVIACLAAT